MNRSLIAKLATIGLLVLLLLIPIYMIKGIIGERQYQRDQVLTDIARSSSDQQKITGPLLVVPYRKTVRLTGERHNVPYEETKEQRGTLYFLPESFELQGGMTTEIRERGIYRARLFHARSTLSGTFKLPALWGIVEDVADYEFGTPYLAIGIRDIRGIENSPKLHFNGEVQAFEPGTLVEFLGDGIHAPLKVQAAKDSHTVEFSLDLDLQGTGQLDLVPVGRESRVSLTSDWPHPSFIGNYLPTRREVGAEGFNAHWQTSFFSTNLQEALDACTVKSQCESFQGRTIGVSLLDPVDQYLKSDRAIKYALLFICLTFAGFFLLEVLKRLAVHPIQYGLVGLSLAIFYLLLMSLAEHIGFTAAYMISAAACVSLNGYYAASALRGWTRGLGFGAGLAALYGLLFGLLSAEDYALLMGSILVFAVLGLFMVLTRKVDWFSIGKVQESAT
jgi:inner membrane protein